jgi:RNA-splicing ligase RtcB
VDYKVIADKHPRVKGKTDTNLNQLGTLGGGNHFIEICVDESDQVWVMLHSGSRGVGNRIGQYFIELARKDMQLHAAATLGVECRKDESVIDETPGAYKDVDAVIAAQSDLVEVVHTIKQVVCVKG